jgi:hypothetical protein
MTGAISWQRMPNAMLANAPYLIMPLWAAFMALGFYLLRNR